MCGRYVLTLPPEAIRSLFNTRNLEQSVPRYNIAPTQPVLAVWEVSGSREAKLARWGIVPHWVKVPREFPLVINARAETMAAKPTFRDALKHQRCVVPASGYYEWKTDAAGRKQPHYITHRDGSPLAMAGLYSTWTGPEGEEIDSLALVTVPANGDVAHIHHRMPALLDSSVTDQWLDVRTVRPVEAMPHIRTAPEATLSSRPVSDRVNSARIDDADLIVEVEPKPAAPAKPARPNDQFDLF